MFFIGLRVLLVGIILVVVDGLAIGLLEDVTKADQAMRPKGNKQFLKKSK